MNNNELTVNVVDGICGIGKTTAAINMINNSDESERYIYITPFLTEVKRIIYSCTSKHFVEPTFYNEEKSKKTDIKKLILSDRNIVTTHSLFSKFDHEVVDLLRNKGYNLIMDEVTDVVDILEIEKKDLQNMLNNYASINQDSSIIWREKDYPDVDGVFSEYKILCDLGCLTVYGDGSSEEIDKKILLWLFPISVFSIFKDIYILTYMFDAQIQKYYYDLYNVKYKYLYVDNFKLTDKEIKYNKNIYKNNINICKNQNMNYIGDNTYALSKNWFKTKENMIYQLKNNCHNFFNNQIKTKSSLNMWSTFKDYRGKLKGKGYSKGFVSLTSRATNEYMDKIAVAYLANRYLNPIVKNFFLQKGVDVLEDKYALSELLQFIFRSAIRNGKPIDIYIPSKRMRTLLENWIESQD